MLGTVLKRFEEPDEVRVLERGKFGLVRIGGLTIGPRHANRDVNDPPLWGPACTRVTL
jgi:hypothetical protein